MQSCHRFLSHSTKGSQFLNRRSFYANALAGYCSRYAPLSSLTKIAVNVQSVPAQFKFPSPELPKVTITCGQHHKHSHNNKSIQLPSMTMGGGNKDAFATMMAAQKHATPHKKGRKQRKIKAYFPPKKNHQGFPIKQCKFQPTEGAHMYLPWWYGQAYSKDPMTEGIYPKYCKHCKLQPCLTVEEKITMAGLGKHIMDFDKKTPAQVRLIIANRLELKRRRIFELDFGAPPSHTKCMTEFVNYWFPDQPRKDFLETELDSLLSPEEMSAKSAAVTDSKAPILDVFQDGVEEEEQQPQFHYGDSDSEEDDSSEGTIPLAILRDHDPGDEPLEEKACCYRKAKARQKATDACIIRSAKEMLELQGGESDEEFEF